MVYRDLKNSFDTARDEGGGIRMGEVAGEERKAFNTAAIMMRNGDCDEKTALYTGLTIAQVNELRKRLALYCISYMDARL